MALLPIIAPARPEELPGAANAARASFAGHIDAAAIAAVTNLYREVLPAGGAILDLMSGWVSHLPPEISYGRVVGLGTNPDELAENAFLDDWRVQDLNRDPRLPFATAEFDGAALCAGVEHLTRPREVIREVGRVLKPGAPFVLTFSNRCRPARPIACWCLLDEATHLCLIASYFAEAGN